MIVPAAKRALEAVLGDAVRFDVPMSRHTSLRIGGPADALASPASRDALMGLLSVCREHALPCTTLGAGFNLLVLDGGVDGVVVTLRKLRGLEERTGPAVWAEAGVSHASITRFCVDRGLAGLEFASGIPGTVGGWIRMNAGIGSREMKDVAQEIEIVTPDGGVHTLERRALDFRYRGLAGLPEGAIILSALFDVTATSREAVRAEVDALLARRSETQPLDVPSCGSVFRNPAGDHAGRLIEQAGLKGERVGGAVISEIHANFIANVGHATAADVLALVERARKRVEATSGVALETEVHVIGRPD